MTTSDPQNRDPLAPEGEAREQPFAGAQGPVGDESGQAGLQGEQDSSPWSDDAAADADAARIAAIEAENADVKDRLLRLAADMENLRRRTEREIKDARQFAVANFARDMLAVSDNLDRALQSIPEEARSSGDAGFTSLVEGVDMTARSMLSSLERHGVKRLAPKGQRFDPNFHQAMFEIPDESVPANTVVQVVQEGYAIGERVLRPAMVGVSRGGPKAGAETRPGVPDETTKDA